MAASVERSSGGGEQNSLTLGSTSVPAVSPVKSLHDVVFEPRAYTKMILHAAKYPHCATNGLLLAQAQKDSRKCLTLTDCIPLFHQVSSEITNSKSHKKKDIRSTLTPYFLPITERGLDPNAGGGSGSNRGQVCSLIGLNCSNSF